MKNLTKVQKFLILASIFWEIVAYRMNYHRHELNFEDFMIASSPVIICWSIVWIWGFEVFKKLFGNVFNSIMDYEIKPAENHNEIKPADNHNTKSSRNIFTLCAFVMYFITGYMVSTSEDTAFRFGFASAHLFFGVVVFYITIILTCFIKDVERRNKTASILFFIASIIFCLGIYFKLQLQAEISSRYTQNIKQQVLGVINKGDNITDDDIKSIQNEDIKVLFNMTIEAAKELGKYADNNNISGITKIGDENLYKTKNGMKMVYDRGKEIVKHVNGLNVEEDINQIYSGYTNKFYNYCIQKHPNTTEICVKFSNTMNNVVNQQKIDISLLFKRKVDLVNLEYDAIKCMYENYGTNNCEDIKHEYIAKALEIEDKAKELQDNYKNKAIRYIKGIE